MQAPVMSVHRSSVIAFGLLVLSECVAFGDGNNQLDAQVAQPAEHQGEHQLGDPIESSDERQDESKAKADEQQDKDQDKSQIGSSAPPPAIAPASDAGSRPDLQASDLRDSVCLMIEAAARAQDLPLEFFARVIWQESRFRPDTVGPRRRNGESAQGIAQFMPSTAAEKGLLDPFDPVQALPKAAQFLRELKDQFGNLGLAAAAYNAGPSRVRGWLAGARMLSVETRNYVAAVTGVLAEEWAKTGARKPAVKTSPNCGELMALLEQPAPPHGPGLSPGEEPVKSRSALLAKNDPIAAPVGPVREDLVTPQQEAPSLRGDMGKQPASPQGSGLSSNGERPKLNNARLARNNPVAAVREELVTPHQEAPYSRGDMKQAASPQGPPPASLEAPAKSVNAQLAKNDPIAAPVGPVREGLVTSQQEAPYMHRDMNLFIAKLTERVKLTADSPWGIQLSAGFSRERVLAAYATVASRYAEILVGKDASILSSVFRSRGTQAFYQIRVGTDTFESANDLCAGIRRAGGACMVLSNRS
jgi:Transglycosylase SLT domain/SPOR domain